MTILIPNRKEPNINLMKMILEYDYPNARILVCDDPKGNGKGWAFKQGIEQADLPIIFIDGDLDIHPYEIKKLLPHLQHYDLVVGKKNLPKKLKRRFITYFSRLFIRSLFGLKIDTQTGLKAFNFIPYWKTDGWAFDIEILYNAKKEGRSMIEIPIKARVSDSKTMKDLWTTFIDACRIRFQ